MSCCLSREDNWILLEYEGGESFHSHCANEDKRTVVMIMCKTGETTVMSLTCVQNELSLLQ